MEQPSEQTFLRKFILTLYESLTYLLLTFLDQTDLISIIINRFHCTELFKLDNIIQYKDYQHFSFVNLQNPDLIKDQIDQVKYLYIFIHSMKAILIFLLSIFSLLQIVQSLNFPLTRSRETCMIISEGSYQIQYVISGHSEQQVRCIIQQNDRVIFQILGKSEFQGQFNVTSGQASICFSSLDNLAKSVSVDFFKTDDPLRGLIQDEKKLKVHEELYKSFQEVEKVYRDQHFFLQRNFIHSILLKQTEVIVIFFILLKIIIAFVCSFFQLYFVKKILEDSFSSLPSQEPRGQSY